MYRLLVDQNVRVEVAEALRKDGHEVVRASETGIARRDDEALLRYGRRRKRALALTEAGKMGRMSF